MRGLFGRRAELEAIFSALGGGLPVEIIGHPGIGKTALLRSLAYHPEAAAFVDGVIYLTARQQPAGDLQQQLFDGFDESDRIRKPTAADIRHALQDKRADEFTCAEGINIVTHVPDHDDGEQPA